VRFRDGNADTFRQGCAAESERNCLYFHLNRTAAASAPSGVSGKSTPNSAPMPGGYFPHLRRDRPGRTFFRAWTMKR
jgi:hypothetical protein